MKRNDYLCYLCHLSQRPKRQISSFRQIQDSCDWHILTYLIKKRNDNGVASAVPVLNIINNQTVHEHQTVCFWNNFLLVGISQVQNMHCLLTRSVLVDQKIGQQICRSICVYLSLHPFLSKQSVSKNAGKYIRQFCN